MIKPYTKNKIGLILISLLVLLSFSSCRNKGGNITPTNNIVIPETYVFERNGATSVGFDGQITRIKMAEEIISALKDASFTETRIDSMYAHVEGQNNFSDANLNSSNKQVRSKTAASFDLFGGSANNAVIADFEGWIAEQTGVVYPVWNSIASRGIPGQLQEAGGGSIRYINEKGLELNQAFNKSLIGAMMVDQILNNYISSNVLNNFEQANNDEILVSGKNYTDMEHDWDEAYGYLYGTAADTTNPNKTVGSDDNFLNKYLGRVNADNDFSGIADDIFKAFKLGRAAIVAKDYTVRNQQAEIIRQKISMIIGVRSVYYLQQAKKTLEVGSPDYAAAFHDLSEAYGFIYSLQFTRKTNSNDPYFTRTQVQGILNDLYGSNTNGFWDLTPAILQTLSETIANQFNFTVEQAGS